MLLYLNRHWGSDLVLTPMGPKRQATIGILVHELHTPCRTPPPSAASTSQHVDIERLFLLGLGWCDGLDLAPTPVPDAGTKGRGDERLEQRVRGLGTRFELGVELTPDEVRMLRQLDHLD